ncbi:MAG: peptidoglycan DD-metalloendopeptidase family protein [Epsilonproteobacteria bacterium]|nr:peptidoglycan DD-metalloendopeptidase family protein [Campylobacterota bacterium]
MRDKLIILLKPYAALLFLDKIEVSVVLFLALLIQPSIAIGGFVALIFTIAFAEFISLKEYLDNGFYLYNSLLVGMGIGYLFAPTLLSVFFIAILSIFTFLLSFILNRLFAVYKIPILSLPFSLVTIVAYLASLRYSHFFSELINNHLIFDIHINTFLDAFFRALGTIFFLPNVLFGLIIFLLLLYASRIMALMALIGFSFGVFIHSLFVTNYFEALHEPYSFNYILVAVALGGVFLLPTIKNYLLALIGVLISVVLVDAMVIFFNYYSLPVFTLPFNIVVMMFVFVLSMIYYKELNYNIKSTPEESLSYYLSNVFRFGGNTVKIALPFKGEWSVYQGFDGEWTHTGKWKYAYDFVIVRNDKTYQRDGVYLEDYYCFNQDIVAPISGYVVALRNDLPDNNIGEVDKINNWGNYIIIKSDYGFFVEISHLKQYSIIPKIGDYVKVYDVIAKCGNSGYSPQPHIHIQVQKFGVLGSETMEFVFDKYYMHDKLVFYGLPSQNELVRAVVFEKQMGMRFNFVLDEVYEYEVYHNQEYQQNISFRVQMNKKGEFYLSDGKNKLFFYNDWEMFYFYEYVGAQSYLKELFKLAAKIPFVTNAKYVDYLPVYLIKSKLESLIIGILASFNATLYKREYQYQLSALKLKSVFGEVTFSFYNKGFETIQFGDTILKRVVK